MRYAVRLLPQPTLLTKSPFGRAIKYVPDLGQFGLSQTGLVTIGVSRSQRTAVL